MLWHIIVVLNSSAQKTVDDKTWDYQGKSFCEFCKATTQRFLPTNARRDWYYSSCIWILVGHNNICSGGEIFGVQRTLIPLHAMFENVIDRTTLSILWELSRIYGREANLFESNPKSRPTVEEEMKVEAWKTAGPLPRPLPPPPARPKSYNIEVFFLSLILMI
ncbi:hypothetical protein ACLB2K_035665 [Fragaria x ananassa]